MSQPHIIDGKKLAEQIVTEVAEHIIDDGLEPQLAVILVGSDPASHMYVKLKEKACKKAGIVSHTYLIDEAAPEKDILDTITFLNNDPDIDAILLQLPLPKKFDQDAIIKALDYRKDVDGFHPINRKNYLAGKPQHILPGLGLAIWNLIASAGEANYVNKHAVVISKSSEFSEPLVKLLSDRKIPTQAFRPDDPGLKTTTLSADILITAIGKPDFISSDMVQEGALVIDVGINKKNGKTVGDVNFESVAPKCSYITPVPGGVGPMTVAMLIYNTWLLAKSKEFTLKQ